MNNPKEERYSPGKGGWKFRLLREESSGRLGENWNDRRKTAFDLTPAWTGISFRRLFAPHTDPWQRWCHRLFADTKTEAQRGVCLGSDKARPWTQAHVLFIYLTCPGSVQSVMQPTLELGCHSFSLKTLGKLFNCSVLCASVSSLKVGLITIAVSKGGYEDSQN